LANKKDFTELHRRLKRPLILDGAMGSLLQQRGIEGDNFLWYSKANLDNPDIVKNIHREYVEAGADIITTNTFRTNPVSLKRSNYPIDQNEFVYRSVQIAVEAREDKDIIIAGSNAPAEDCYQEERTIPKYSIEYNHKKHIELLWESGSDIILNETQSHWDEIKIICEFCKYNSLPFIVSLYFTNNLKILSGEPVKEVVQFVNDYKPLAVGFNCIKPDTFKKYFIENNTPGNWGFYINCGTGNVFDETISCGITPEQYTAIVKEYLPEKPVFIGSCCGSSPLHSENIKEYFDEIY
jgi:homocysteine S-methyltransferase